MMTTKLAKLRENQGRGWIDPSARMIGGALLSPLSNFAHFVPFVVSIPLLRFGSSGQMTDWGWQAGAEVARVCRR